MADSTPTKSAPSTPAPGTPNAVGVLPSPTKVGSLKKQNSKGLLKSWKRRLFMIENYRFKYFVDTSSDKPKRSIDLSEYNVEREASKPLVFKLVKIQEDEEETMTLQANSEEEAQAWMTAMMACKKAAATLVSPGPGGESPQISARVSTASSGTGTCDADSAEAGGDMPRRMTLDELIKEEGGSADTGAGAEKNGIASGAGESKPAAIPKAGGDGDGGGDGADLTAGSDVEEEEENIEIPPIPTVPLPVPPALESESESGSEWEDEAGMPVPAEVAVALVDKLANQTKSSADGADGAASVNADHTPDNVKVEDATDNINSSDSDGNVAAESITANANGDTNVDEDGDDNDDVPSPPPEEDGDNDELDELGEESSTCLIVGCDSVRHISSLLDVVER